jgi:hypothetical protein
MSPLGHKRPSLRAPARPVVRYTSNDDQILRSSEMSQRAKGPSNESGIAQEHDSAECELGRFQIEDGLKERLLRLSHRKQGCGARLEAVDEFGAD